MTNNNQVHSKEKGNVSAMFNAIAPRYDILNHILSMNIDKGWRRLLASEAASHGPGKILDVATGTADLAITLARRTDASVTGIDISEGMIEIGKKKIETLHLNNRITLAEADAAQIPYETNFFDTATVAFGVRNFENTLEGLSEMCRVVKPGGRIYVLEFSSPKGITGSFVRFYMRRLMPLIGGLISGHPSAYRYLPETALSFPEGEAFDLLLRYAGYRDIKIKRLTFGVATLYEGVKPITK